MAHQFLYDAFRQHLHYAHKRVAQFVQRDRRYAIVGRKTFQRLYSCCSLGISNTGPSDGEISRWASSSMRPSCANTMVRTALEFLPCVTSPKALIARPMWISPPCTSDQRRPSSSPGRTLVRTLKADSHQGTGDLAKGKARLVIRRAFALLRDILPGGQKPDFDHLPAIFHYPRQPPR